MLAFLFCNSSVSYVLVQCKLCTLFLAPSFICELAGNKSKALQFWLLHMYVLKRSHIYFSVTKIWFDTTTGLEVLGIRRMLHRFGWTILGSFFSFIQNESKAACNSLTVLTPWAVFLYSCYGLPANRIDGS